MRLSFMKSRRVAGLVLALSLFFSQALPSVFATQEDAGASQMEWDAIKLTNAARISSGVRPLSVNASISHMSETRAAEVGGFFSHTRPDGSRFSTLFTEMGFKYSRAGENIAHGQQTAGDTINAWLDSPPHMQNLLHPDYHHIGIGYVTGNVNSPAWVQSLFTNHCSTASIGISDVKTECEVGDDIDSLDGCVEVACSVHGTCYMPLIAEMCSGFDSSIAGMQTVTVTCEGISTTFSVNVSAETTTSISDDSPPTSSGPETGSSLPFTDIQGDDFYYSAVNYAYKHGLMHGVGGSKFDPDSSVNRAMVVEILFRVAGNPEVSGASRFSDVGSDDWFCKSVNWAAQNGIVNGIGDRIFDPYGTVTREQFAAILFRYSNSPQTDSTTLSGVYDRDSVSEWAVPAVSWALEEKIIELNSGSAFVPASSIKRYECAMILTAYFNS